MYTKKKQGNNYMHHKEIEFKVNIKVSTTTTYPKKQNMCNTEHCPNTTEVT